VEAEDGLTMILEQMDLVEVEALTLEAVEQ
jgi:hypothetical protein